LVSFIFLWSIYQQAISGYVFDCDTFEAHSVAERAAIVFFPVAGYFENIAFMLGDIFNVIIHFFIVLYIIDCGKKPRIIFPVLQDSAILDIVIVELHVAGAGKSFHDPITLNFGGKNKGNSGQEIYGDYDVIKIFFHNMIF
jgi:hypothetical protein